MNPTALLLLVFLAFLPAPARAETMPEEAGGSALVTDSTKGLIDIDLSYHGDRIHFFGALEGIEPDGVVVKLTSPAERVKLNIAGRVGPLWMNVKQYEVENVPFMYKIHASAPMDQLVPPDLARQLGLGFETVKEQLTLHLVKGEAAESDKDTLFDGLLKLKNEGQLVQKSTTKSRIRIKNGKIFQHYFTFPSAAKAGEYQVESFVFKDGKLVGKAIDTIRIRKVGLEAFVANAAQNHPVLYGISAVIIALAAGLIVGYLFKGGAH